MKTELYKQIAESKKDIFYVSDKGNVKAVSKKTMNERQIPKYELNGYLYAQIPVGVSKWRTVGVHRLVAKAFIDNPNNFTYVNHKDENKHNNTVGNLEWCTHSYNLKYSFSTQEAIERRNKKHELTLYKRKLKLEQEKQERKRIREEKRLRKEELIEQIKQEKKRIKEEKRLKKEEERRNLWEKHKIYEYDKDFNLISVYPTGKMAIMKNTNYYYYLNSDMPDKNGHYWRR